MKPSVTLISGTYNRLQLLAEMVESARAALPRGIPLDFILVDGGSTDGTLEWCEAQRDVTLIEHGELRGAIRAFCDGAAQAQGKYVVLANDDVSFFPDSLVRAVVYLEEVLTCGAVAFEDNRPLPYQLPEYHVLHMPAMRNGKKVMVAYAQVGMFRRWLGDACGWWGADDPRFGGRTYAGDNFLSSKIWERGYTVEKVEGCRVYDTVIDDGLRQINRDSHPERDSDAYYRYPDWLNEQGEHVGATIPDKPMLPQQDRRMARILYLPIFETNHTPELGPTVQQQQKRGLRDALSKVAWVYELDYLNTPNDQLLDTVLRVMDTFRPDMLLTQLQSTNLLTADMLRQIRLLHPGKPIVNWNGDTHRDNLINGKMLELLRYVDLQLVVNQAVIETYRQQEIPAAYWQNAFEPTNGTASAPRYDVVFLGSGYNENRQSMARMLRELLGERFGLYGDFWQDAQGRTLYDFEFSGALNKNAKIAVGSNEFPDDYGFISNRLFETMAAGGCLFLMQHVPGLEELTGITAGKHFVQWRDLDDLREKVLYYLDPAHEKERARIAKAGTKYVRRYHNFDARVLELFDKLLPIARQTPRRHAGLRYKGFARSQFGVMGHISGRHYLVEPEQTLFVDPRDVEGLTRDGLFEAVRGMAADDEIARSFQR